jgi:hypothetical protein
MRQRIFFALLLALPVPAEPQHSLEYVLPRGAMRGTTVDVSLHGKYLNDPKEILFYGPGIKAISLTVGAKPGEDVNTRFVIAPDCPIGEHVLRLRTAQGMTEAMTFWVSRFPTVMETEKKIGENDTPATAQNVPINSTVEGQIHPGDHMDRDVYAVRARKGERLSVELDSVRLGTLHFSNGENDLTVRILDEQGEQIAHADDSSLHAQDPILSLVAPYDGRYFIEISQQVYQAPRQAWYRVHIGNFSRPTGLYPAGGPAGKPLSVKVLGDPAGSRTETVPLPQQTGDFDYFAGGRGEQPPSPNVLRVSPYPNVLKSEGGTLTSVPSLPIALNGIYSAKGHADQFRFTAKKGDAWKIRVYARTLGSPMDPKIWIRAENNPKNLLEADDSRLNDLGLPSNRNTWTTEEMLDPMTLLRVPADGAYILGIEDTRGLAGPDYVYRVEIEPVHDAIYTHITSPDAYQIPRTVGLIIPQGNRWTLNVQIAQGFGNNYKDDVELEAVGLPPGVSMIAPRFTKGVNRLPVQFIAGPDVKPQSALIELRARAVNDVAPLETGSRQAFALFNRPGEYPWHIVFLEKYALAVTDRAPFHVELEQPGVPLTKNGELMLKVKVLRDDDFKQPIEIQTDWLPPNVASGGAVTIPANKSEAEFKIQSNPKAALGVYQLAMNATTQGGDGFSGFGRVRVSSAFVKLEIADPYVTIDLRRSSVERGEKGEIAGVLKLNRPFEGKATVSLKGLPKGVRMLDPAPEITAKDQQVTFKVEADADALLGLSKDVACDLKLTDKGETIHQQIGSGTLRVDPSRGAKPTAPNESQTALNIFDPSKLPHSKFVGPVRPPSFRLDVMPVFFRAGCNSGGCHGAASGKDGFHLSLFGYDPAGDFFRLTQQMVGRRIDLAEPEESLILLKATGVVPHSGGRRFKPDSELYETLVNWIKYGAMDDGTNTPQVTGISLVPDKVVFSGKETNQPLQVIAKYSDGSTRPVNQLALYLTNDKNVADISDQGVVTAGKRGDTFVFARFAKFTTGAEVIVLPKDQKFKWPNQPENNYIDTLVDTKLKYLRIVPSAPATDEQFLRRVYLDLIGLPPTPEEYKSFMDSHASNKRAKLIDDLLAREEFADVWAAKWAETLKVFSGPTSAFGTDTKAAAGYYDWIRDQIRKDTPLDQFVRSQVASSGSNLSDPPVNFYTMIPQGAYDPKAVALDVAQAFTGVRIQCAQCHNHPFDRWTMEDFYGFVSFFTGVKRKVEGEPRDFYIYDDPAAPPAKHLLDNHPVPAKFLGGDTPNLSNQDPRAALADWLTSKDNALFRENMANRIWAHFMGRGIVEPVDDVRVSNPPSNKELLTELGLRLASYSFDMKRLIRDICNSRIYQLSSVPNESNRDDETQFSHARLRRLRADVLVDSISQVTDTKTSFGNAPTGLRAVQLYEGNRRANNYFLKTFGIANRDTVGASETRLEPTLTQALHLINGDTVEGKVMRSPVLTHLMQAKLSPDAILDELYERALSRKPSRDERKRLLEPLQNAPQDRKAYEDVFWALLNSSEFEFNH